MTYTSLRTQITLPISLREEIEKARRITNESLAEYLREAVKIRLTRESSRRVNYKKLAEDIIGAVPKSSWQGINASAWQKQMRQDRK